MSLLFAVRERVHHIFTLLSMNRKNSSATNGHKASYCNILNSPHNVDRSEGITLDIWEYIGNLTLDIWEYIGPYGLYGPMGPRNLNRFLSHVLFEKQTT